jgi:hypothetical protein
MVEVHLENEEVECAIMYNTLGANEAQSGNVDCSADMVKFDKVHNQEEIDHLESKLRY